MVLAPSLARAQQSTGTVVVTVVDSLVQPIGGADLILTGADSGATKGVTKTIRVGDGGIGVIGGVPAGHYVLTVRKVGYRPSTRDDLPITAGDTAKVMLMLQLGKVELEKVKVTGRKGSALARPDLMADEINTKYVWSIRDALNRYRPGIIAPQCESLPVKVYVNGVRRDFKFGRDILEDIRSEEMQEVHYVSCTDTKVPIDMTNALFVVLKPKALSKKQKKELQELMRDTTTKADSTKSDSTKSGAPGAPPDTTTSPSPTP